MGTDETAIHESVGELNISEGYRTMGSEDLKIERIRAATEIVKVWILTDVQNAPGNNTSSAQAVSDAAKFLSEQFTTATKGKK